MTKKPGPDEFRRIAHDLNNVLAAIDGFGALVADRVTGDPDAAECMREVLQAAERGKDVIERLRVLADDLGS